MTARTLVERLKEIISCLQGESRRTEAREALDGLAARIAELEAQVAGMVRDAGRFRKLQNMPPIMAQALFFQYGSRKQRAKAIDEIDAALQGEKK